MKYKIEAKNFGFGLRYHVYKKPWYRLYWEYIGCVKTKEEVLELISSYIEIDP